jgi:hypothetical protein
VDWANLRPVGHVVHEAEAMPERPLLGYLGSCSGECGGGIDRSTLRGNHKACLSLGVSNRHPQFAGNDHLLKVCILKVQLMRSRSEGESTSNSLNEDGAHRLENIRERNIGE